MRRFLSPLGLLFAVGCAGPPAAPAAPPRPGPPLMVMSYNVNYGLAGDEPTLAAIAGGGADIVFLQETNPAWERVLRRRLAGRYPQMAFRHSGGPGGLAVLSRQPVVEVAFLPSPGGWFPAWQLFFPRTPVGSLTVLNVHLRPPVSDSGSWVSGYFTTDDFRHREILHFERGLDLARGPTLVVGDFNEGERGQAVAHLRRRGLRCVVDEHQPGARTWRWPTSVGRLQLVLDHILYSRHLAPVEARVLRAGRSDHLPLVAAFRRR